MFRLVMVVSLAGLISLPCLSQTGGSGSEKPATVQQAENLPKKFYQLSFVVQELENERVINSRSYSVIMSNDKPGSSIRAGEKVPFSSTSGTSTQWQQIDVGVNIDCSRLEELGNAVSLSVKASMSSVMEAHGENSPPSSLPIIRNNQWESSVVLPLKQPTILFASDDPASKRKMQLQLTVTTIR